MRFVIFSPEDLKYYTEALIKFTKCWNSYHAKVSFDKENHRNESAAEFSLIATFSAPRTR